MSLKVEVWSDVVCPWCYVGKRRFEAALARFAHRNEVELIWRSFELDVSAPPSSAEQGTYAERLASKYGCAVAEAQVMIDNMTVTAAREGLDLRLASTPTVGSSRSSSCSSTTAPSSPSTP